MTQITGLILHYFNCWWHITEEKKTQKTSACNVPGAPGMLCVYIGTTGCKWDLIWINERVTKILKETINTSGIKERKVKHIWKGFYCSWGFKYKTISSRRIYFKTKIAGFMPKKHKNTVTFKRNSVKSRKQHSPLGV